MMVSDMGSLALSEFTSELSHLLLKKDADGLSHEERVRLEDMQLCLRPHAGPAGSPEERRQFLRLEISAGVEMESESDGAKPEHAACLELGIGGLCVRTTPALPVDSMVRLQSLLVDGDRVVLGVRAKVVRAGLWAEHTGVGLEFLDLDPEGIGRVQRAFDHLFERAVASPGVDVKAAGRTPAIADERVLAQICQTLLGRAGMERMWSVRGPTDRGRDVLSANGRPLPVGQRVLLLFVWRLWTGICDLRSTEFWYLDPDTQHVVTDLMLAVEAGPTQLDDWLERHRSDEQAVATLLS